MTDPSKASNHYQKEEKVADAILSVYSEINWTDTIAAQDDFQSKCPNDDQLIMFIAEELSEKEAFAIKRHLLVCDKCTHEMAVLLPIVQAPVCHDSSFILPESIQTAMEKEFERIQKKHQPFSEKISVAADKITDGLQKGKQLVKSIAKEMIIQITPFWEPLLVGQPVTASDITRQRYRFLIESGQIALNCHWKSEDKSDPAFLFLSWKVNISIDCQVWARFENPETHDILSEICLGDSMAGEDYFTIDDLGFDPSTTRWAVAIIFTELRR
ncbi:MAG: hypothetical protein HQK75_16015 [Candidatus Magnetomorum sp.]|nr:hypothetical protein [Candidatus Magnetomorum sp.]